MSVLRLVAVFCATIFVFLPISNASAAILTFDIQESGNDVVVTASGSVDLSDFSEAGTITVSGEVLPFLGRVIIGPTTSSGFLQIYFNSSFVGLDLGPGSTNFSANAFSGDIIGVENGQLVLPDGYQSLDALFGTMTFLDATLATLGFDPGTYTRSSANNVWTFNIGQPSEVPLPAAAWLFIAGFGGLGFGGLRKRSLIFA